MCLMISINSMILACTRSNQGVHRWRTYQSQFFGDVMNAVFGRFQETMLVSSETEQDGEFQIRQLQSRFINAETVHCPLRPWKYIEECNEQRCCSGRPRETNTKTPISASSVSLRSGSYQKLLNEHELISWIGIFSWQFLFTLVELAADTYMHLITYSSPVATFCSLSM